MKYLFIKFLFYFVALVYFGSAAGVSNAVGATISTFPVGLEPKCVAIADFNNDGKKDLAVVNRGSYNVSILLGDGAGNFAAATNFSTGDTFAEPFALAVGDFNGDAKSDVIVSKPNVHAISILIGSGNGQLGVPADFSVGESPGTFVVGDFNADGKSDVAVADSGFNIGGVYVLLGTGTGNFGTPTRFPAGTRPRHLAMADFNRDGKSDLAVANVGFNFNKISILIGNGAGGFGAPKDITVGSSPIGLVVGDYNADSFLDIAVANTDSHNISILKGNGAGDFGAPTNFPANPFPLSIATGDFDHDGKLDLAVGANNTGDRISILRGDGSGQFASPASFSAGAGPYDLVAGDLNGDAKSDLATANATSNNVSVLLGNLPTVQISSNGVIEGNSGTTTINFPVDLSGSINKPVTIFRSVTDGTATGGSDFEPSNGQVTIPEGALTANISVSVFGDNTFEPDETFAVNLSSSLNAFIVNGQALGTIQNDDPVPAIAIADVSVVEGNAGTKNAVFTVSLTNPSYQSISVNVATADITAAAGVDYLSQTGSVTFSPSQTTRNFTVLVTGDTRSELTETFSVNLTSPVNASISRAQAIGTILDDDPAALLTEPGSQRAIALESVTFLSNPFPIVNDHNFSADHRSRIILFAVNLNLAQGETITVQGEDAQHVVRQLPVEFAGPVPGFGGLWQIVMGLPAGIAPGDVVVSFTLRGQTSNNGVITLKP